MALFRNPDKRKSFAWFCASLLALFLALALLPSVIPAKVGTPEYHGTQGFSSFMAVLVITGISFIGFIVSLSFLWSSFKLDGLLKGKDALARWEYTDEEMKKVKQQMLEGGEKMKSRLLLYSFGIILLLGIIAAAIDPSNPILVAAWVFGICLLLWIAAIVLERAAERPDSAFARQVIIAPYGALFCGTFHFWKTFASSLSSISLSGNHGARTLRISYMVASEHGAYNVKIEIPVPVAREKDAAKAVEEMTIARKMRI